MDRTTDKSLSEESGIRVIWSLVQNNSGSIWHFNFIMRVIYKEFELIVPKCDWSSNSCEDDKYVAITHRKPAWNSILRVQWSNDSTRVNIRNRIIIIKIDVCIRSEVFNVKGKLERLDNLYFRQTILDKNEKSKTCSCNSIRSTHLNFIGSNVCDKIHLLKLDLC